IAFVGRCDTNRCLKERLKGVKEALSSHGIILQERMIIPDGEQWLKDLELLMKGSNRPTAFVMGHDIYALKSYRPLAEMGFSIPDDVSIVCFGDDHWARHLTPALSTTNENIHDVAHVAMDLLFRRIENPDLPPQN